MASLKVKVDPSELDAAIEKASRLKELLQEVTTLINSLGCRKENEILIIETPSAPLKSLDEIRTMIKRNFGSVEVR